LIFLFSCYVWKLALFEILEAIEDEVLRDEPLGDRPLVGLVKLVVIVDEHDLSGLVGEIIPRESADGGQSAAEQDMKGEMYVKYALGSGDGDERPMLPSAPVEHDGLQEVVLELGRSALRAGEDFVHRGAATGTTIVGAGATITSGPQ